METINLNVVLIISLLICVLIFIYAFAIEIEDNQKKIKAEQKEILLKIQTDLYDLKQFVYNNDCKLDSIEKNILTEIACLGTKNDKDISELYSKLGIKK